MFKNSLIYLSLTVIIFSACKKDEPASGTDTTLAFVSFTNANFSTNLSITRPVNLFIDGVKKNNVGFIGTNSTISGTYVGVAPGTRTVVLRDTLSTSNIDYLTLPINVAGGRSYSFYLYDTVKLGQLKGILLTTDRTPDPDNANSKIRFLNLAPGSPALDFVAVRREAAVAKDSVVLFTNMPYLGDVASPDIPTLSTFKVLAASTLAGALTPTSPASDYIFRVKLAGTNTAVSSTGAITVVNSRNYTYFARGKYPAVTISFMLNNN